MPSDLNLIKKKKAADGNQATRPVSRETQRKRAEGRKEGRGTMRRGRADSRREEAAPDGSGNGQLGRGWE